MTTGASRAGVLISTVAVLFVLVAIAALVTSPGPESAQIVANGAFVVVGGLIVVRRPGNVIGPLVMAFGLMFQSLLALSIVGDRAAEAGNVELAGWLATIGETAFPFTAWLMVPMLVLFPDGRSTSRWMRRLIIGSAAVASVQTVLNALATPGSVTTNDLVFVNPIVSESTAETMRQVADTVMMGSIIFLLIAAGTLVPKWRRGNAVERRQIGWLAIAGLAYFIIAGVNTAAEQAGAIDGGWFLFVDAVGVILIPLAIGVAIMRYRLYEIDTIVNRSLVYGSLAAFIGGVYVAIVVGVAAVLGGDVSFQLSIVATILVALAFQPVRRRVERWANHLVYGERATPYEILQRFSRRSSEMSDEVLLGRIPRLIVDGTGAATAAVWVRSDDGFHTASVWPEDASPRTIAVDATFADPESDFSLPVFHDGELLGGISLVKAGGETVTPQDEELLGSLASGLGLALRNARLTTTLRARVAELEASRERILTASDAARRAIENALDSGAQQTLVALKVKLGPTRKLAERAGAEKAAGLLAQLERDAGEAIASVRDFASGIYPPLLEAEGLAIAISHQASKAALPVSVHTDGVQRYSRETEAAVYFSVLEALQNTAKYAEADTASVTLTQNSHVLRFEVRDDGAGFDSTSVLPGAGLNGMADRLDTVGGDVRVESSPGEGTVVAGSVPIEVLATA